MKLALYFIYLFPDFVSYDWDLRFLFSNKHKNENFSAHDYRLFRLEDWVDHDNRSFISVQLMEESAGKKRIKLEQNGDLTYFLDAEDVPAWSVARLIVVSTSFRTIPRRPVFKHILQARMHDNHLLSHPMWFDFMWWSF